MTSDNASLIEEYRNLVKTGAEYAASELRLAPTSVFEIYIGHFRDIGRDIEAALSTPPKVGSGELDAAGLDAARRAANAVMAKLPPVEVKGEGALVFSADFTNEFFSEAIRAYLALAAPVDHPEVVGVKIKPLEWVETAPWTWEAESYKVYENMDMWHLAGTKTISLPYNLCSEAMDAAQLDYETRIRSALRPSDSPALEAGAAVERSTLEFAAWALRKHNFLECADIITAALSDRKA